MKKELLQYICCPNCKKDLKLECFEINGIEIIKGTLYCDNCSVKFPIINGIPIFLPGSLSKNFFSTGNFSTEYISKTNNSQVFEDTFSYKEKKAVYNSFSYEWQRWSVLPEYAENDFLEITKVPKLHFNGKIGLDVGCGNGRYLEFCSNLVGPNGIMIGIELSDAVEIAYKRTQFLQNVHVIQADVYNLPLKEKIFDFVYFIGVLQHLPDPQGAILKAKYCMAAAGVFYGTFYTYSGMLLTSYVYILRFLRIFTINLPMKIILKISKLLSIPVYIVYKIPPKYLVKISPYFKAMIEQFPNKKNIGNPNFRYITHIWFDHLSVPIWQSFTKKQAERIVSNTNLEILPDNNWTGLVVAKKS